MEPVNNSLNLGGRQLTGGRLLFNSLK